MTHPVDAGQVWLIERLFPWKGGGVIASSHVLQLRNGRPVVRSGWVQGFHNLQDPGRLPAAATDRYGSGLIVVIEMAKTAVLDCAHLSWADVMVRSSRYLLTDCLASRRMRSHAHSLLSWSSILPN